MKTKENFKIENQETENPNSGNEKETANELPKINIDSLAGSLADEQPEVSQHTVDAEMEKQDQRKKQFSEFKDSDGFSFDPEVHVTDANGDPVLTKTDKLRKRPGRKGGARPGSSGPSHVATPGASAQNSGQVDATEKRRTAGVHAARMMTSMATMLGGEEWKPKKLPEYGLDEQEGLNEAFADYFEAKEMEDIPPGIALTMVVMSYAGPRFAMPQTRSRVGKLKDWAAAKWFNYKVGKKKGKVRQLPREEEKEEDK